MKKASFTVTGMSCAACSASVEKAVKNLDGVFDASVILNLGKLTVEYDEDKLSKKDIERAVTKIGFGVNYNSFKENFASKTREVKKIKTKLIASSLFAIPLFYISMGYMLGFPVPKFMDSSYNPFVYAVVQLLLALMCMIVGYKFYFDGFRNLFTLRPNMDSLVAVGTSSAFIYGIVNICIGTPHYEHNLYFESVGVILTLILFGKFLENRSKLKTNDAIISLMELTPPKATVIRNGEKISVDINDVKIGDTVAISPGEKIAVDGVIIKGQTTVDESALTGESMPVEKEEGSKVFAGCINKYGYIEVNVTVSNNDTVISQIVNMVEQASGSKPELAKLADKICGVFVPCVIAIAIATLIIWLVFTNDISVSIDRFISVLVVACPCALGLATPTAVIVSVGRAAKEGILVKDSSAMEHLNRVDTFVFDKTGTLTKGEPAVVDFYVMDGFDKDELLTVAMSVEAVSEHPLSDAIYEYALKEGATEKEISGFEAIGGRGITATLDGKTVLLGNSSLMEENLVKNTYKDILDEYTKNGKTTMILSLDGEAAAVISAKDVLKEDSKDVIKTLKDAKIKTILLTGDNAVTAKTMADELGIDTCISEVLPAEKAEKIKELMRDGKKVAMIGDGINDSVALTVADVGIAVGSGTQVAIESADVVIMRDKLSDIIKTKNISYATMKNIRQNLFYAFIYNSILIPVAAGALSFIGLNFSPMAGAAAMALSSVSVVLNALRLKKVKI